MTDKLKELLREALEWIDYNSVHGSRDLMDRIGAALNEPAVEAAEIERYTRGVHGNLIPANSGEWVRYSDHRRILAGVDTFNKAVELEIANDQNERMRGLLKDMRRCSESKSIASFLFDIDKALSDPTGLAGVNQQAGSGWIEVSERLPEPGVTVMVYAPPQPGDYPDTVRIAFDGIDPESNGDYWVDHGEHYEHYCCIAKDGDHDWHGPSEKAPYTHWQPLPPSPAAKGDTK